MSAEQTFIEVHTFLVVECYACGDEVNEDECEVILVDPGDRECPPEYGAICLACQDGADAALEAVAEARWEAHWEMVDYGPF